MKNLKFVLAFLFAAALYSCLDTEEKIVLNDDNSGTYSMTIDLGRTLKMAGSMGGDNSNPDKVKKKKDTTVYLKDLINKADNLTDAEKTLYKNGMVHVNLDEEKNEMKIVMSSPFKNTTELTEIKNNFFTALNKLNALNQATGEKANPDEDAGDMQMLRKSASPLGQEFTFSAGGGKISNIITNMDAFKNKLSTDSTFSMMSQMTSMMGDFKYRTIIVLPKTVKKYEGPGSIISGDKKTISFETTLTEMLEHPEKVSYKVAY